MKLRFTYLLPILLVAMVLYEFYTYGFTIYASVNKLLLGIVYGTLIYILLYLLKYVVTLILGWFRSRSESKVSQFIQ